MTPLPKPSIDHGPRTGADGGDPPGVYWNYETDLFRGILEKTQQHSARASATIPTRTSRCASSRITRAPSRS
jgi:hypothetical protein